MPALFLPVLFAPAALLAFVPNDRGVGAHKELLS
jgi:hypothetical protein